MPRTGADVLGDSLIPCCAKLKETASLKSSNRENLDLMCFKLSFKHLPEILENDLEIVLKTSIRKEIDPEAAKGSVYLS